MGIMLNTGEGVEEDKEQAFHYFNVRTISYTSFSIMLYYLSNYNLYTNNSIESSRSRHCSCCSQSRKCIRTRYRSAERRKDCDYLL